jgi:drug/metabolite transporter (DMT)-like permease
VALCGVALISLVGNIHGDLFYVALALIAAVSSGFSNVYLKRFSHCEPLTTLPPAMLLAGVVLTAIGATVEHVSWQRALAPSSLAALTYLAVCGSAVAFYLNHWLLQRIDSGIMGLSALMIPVIAVVVGVAFGGEVFTIRDVIGAVLVLAGVWLSLSRPNVSAIEMTTEPHLAA